MENPQLLIDYHYDLTHKIKDALYNEYENMFSNQKTQSSQKESDCHEVWYLLITVSP